MSLTALAAATLAVAAPTPEAPIVVDGKPISRGHLRHWMDIARSSPGSTEAQYRTQVAGLLISHRWIKGEARELGIHVARGKVRAEFKTQVRQSFPRRAEFRAFLRDSNQSARDLRTRVSIDILSNRIRRHVLDGIDDPEEQQVALEAWVAEWRSRWRARTVCRAPWITTDCRRAPIRGYGQARSSAATIRSA